jgi:5-formyltetrahydrofolate cyclo-ligase
VPKGGRRSRTALAETGGVLSKAELRRRIIERRRGLDAYALAMAARDLRDVLLASPEVSKATCAAAYVSVGVEPGTGPLLEALADRGVRVLLPVLLPDGDLDWGTYEGPMALTAVTRGLLEPTGEPLGVDAVLDADVVLVPGLAVDHEGTRLGRGGGSYDRVLLRALTQRTPPTWSCVLLHEGEVLDSLPKDPHDVPVMAAATPRELIRFRDR